MKRITKKREFVSAYATRPETLRDPFEKDGKTSEAVLTNELQAIGDLEGRMVRIRTAIQLVNLKTSLKVGAREMTIAEWLTWKKDVATSKVAFTDRLRQAIIQARTVYQRTPVAVGQAPPSLLVNLDEKALAKESEEMEQILGDLDGQLSLLNATTLIEV